MNRRRFLAGVGAAAATATGYGALRVADIRPYDPGVPADDLGAAPTPRERVLAAVRHLFEADHRSVTRVRMAADWTGEAPYPLTRHRELHEHSRRRHTHALTTYANGVVRLDRERDGVDARTLTPYATINAYIHFVDATLADPETLPERFVFHVADGSLAYDRDAPEQAVGDPVTVDGGYAGTAPVADFERPLFGEPIRPHRASWSAHDRDDVTVTYRLSGADAYARAVPLPFVAVEAIHDDAAVRATLDRDTGRLLRVVDDRHLDVDVGVDRRDVRTVRMRLVTEIDRYGDAAAPRPDGEYGASPQGSFLDGPALRDRLAGLAYDLRTY
ncbi:hypothetical protein [Halobaculum magnesiiphilum]|uniref:Uncharacterized protein n=1 Tax=Halobaculum magnesiiphilum TaxID=1017351 RepID=A0A8T8WFI7_9EURY|nr:hypothetical protein [Halobaculum magnesiiphilum]QZP38619.1 hypothetical protein K6T50_05625 [Halobaculum magnesiiphilum]